MWLLVTKVTGIDTAMLRSERPLSVVLPLFLEWVATSISYVSDVTHTPHYPGTIYMYVCMYVYNVCNLHYSMQF